MRDFFGRLRGGSSVIINGQSYSGTNISISNGRVIIDGKDVEDASTSPKIEVCINGAVEELQVASGDVVVHGDVGSLSSTSGDVSCRDVAGNVTTTSGDVKCGSVHGNVTTVTGDIRR